MKWCHLSYSANVVSSRLFAAFEKLTVFHNNIIHFLRSNSKIWICCLLTLCLSILCLLPDLIPSTASQEQGTTSPPQTRRLVMVLECHLVVVSCWRSHIFHLFQSSFKHYFSNKKNNRSPSGNSYIIMYTTVYTYICRVWTSVSSFQGHLDMCPGGTWTTDPESQTTISEPKPRPAV